MKLLGWMHRKLRSSNETQKDLSIGFTGSIHDQQCYPRDSNGNKYHSKSQEDKYFRRSFISLEATKAENECEEEPAAALTQLFHGFLTIGTLGAEPYVKDQASPTFSISVDSIDEEKKDVNEDEPKLMKNETEKVQEALLNDGKCNNSSEENSHISPGEKNHFILMTPGTKSVENAEACGKRRVVCHPQSCPLGSTTELPYAAELVKKKQSMTLMELFHKNKQTEENSGIKSDKGKITTGKEVDKSAIHIIKKFMKRRTLQGLVKSCTNISGGTSKSTTVKKKFNKIMQTFSRKVHPEDTLLANQGRKPGKKWTEKRDTCNAEHKSGGTRSLVEDILMHPQEDLPQQSIIYTDNQSHVSLLTEASLNAPGNECWIKTDADYVVLEL